MSMFGRLSGYLHRIFTHDPRPFLALRLTYPAGVMTWAVEDGRLTTMVTGGPGQSLDIDLSAFTLGGLVGHLAAQPGYEINYAETGEFAVRSALILAEGSGNQAVSNGDHIYGDTTLIGSWVGAMARELSALKVQIPEMLAQMSIPTAGGGWLDYHGRDHYAVPRLAGELDGDYAARIIAEVLRPRGNNVAIEVALTAALGQSAQVIDAVNWGTGYHYYDGTYTYDGTINYDAYAAPIYGLFDVVIGYELTSASDISAYGDLVRTIVDRMRDAGTHLRSLVLTGSELADSGHGPACDELYLEMSYARNYDGAVNYDGTWDYSGAMVVAEIYACDETVLPVTAEGGGQILYLDGSWVLDGSQDLDGIRN